MQVALADPLQRLALLPLGEAGRSERQWLQETLAWLKSAPPQERTVRLRALAAGLNADAALCDRFQKLWTRSYAPRLYSEAALPEARSLLREFMLRVQQRFLPQVEDDMDLYAALRAAELSATDADWISGLSGEDAFLWRILLGSSTSDFPVAIRLLALRAAAVALSRSVMQVMPHQRETESPFFDLVDAAIHFTRSPRSEERRDRLREIVLRCRISAGLAHANMEEQGVSADLVFRLDLVIAQLDRIEALLRVSDGGGDGRQWAAMLVRAVAEERGLHNLVRGSINRVARRVVAHTGKSGEHYIAGSQSGWTAMGYGALGAGAITAFTAWFKYLFAATSMAPLWIGVAHSLNYTVSFVLMQLLGWKLASKMPAMTAAALADALENEDGMQSEVRLVAAIARTQTIVTVGNLLGAIPLAIAIDLLIRSITGRPLLSHDAALHGVDSMHPLRSLTIPFAALTGFFLWCSSLFAGWTANWMVLHRLPTAIAQDRKVRRVFGPTAAIRIADFVKHHFSGVAGYFALGVMLGLLPFVGVFAGIPLEVRHITLASASLAYDLNSLAWEGGVPTAALGWAALGLLATGILNIGVSFALGLWLAVRARNLDTNGRKRLIVALWNEFRRHPARFLWSHPAEPILKNTSENPSQAA